MPCLIKDCEKPVHGRGYCSSHYAYFRRTSQEWQEGVGKIVPMAVKFWPKVAVKGPKDCWEWTAAIQRSTGYGLIGRGGYLAGSEGAHRVSYELNVGKIPPGMIVMHTCDNRLCVNPAHLRVGSHKDNTADMIRKGRKAKPEPTAAWGRRALNADLVRYIRASPKTGPELARELGVSKKTIYSVRQRRSWVHLE